MSYTSLPLFHAFTFVVHQPVFLMQISAAPRRALLLRRAVRVEVVELAAGEHLGVGPLAVFILRGSLDTPSNMPAGLPLSPTLRPPFMTGVPLVRGVDNHLLGASPVLAHCPRSRVERR